MNNNIYVALQYSAVAFVLTSFVFATCGANIGKIPLMSEEAKEWCSRLFPEEKSCIIDCEQESLMKYQISCSVRPGTRNIINLQCELDENSQPHCHTKD